MGAVHRYRIQPDSPYMPCCYAIDKARRLVITTAWDRVTFADAKGHQDELYADPAFSRDFNQLIDATAVTHIDASADEIRMLASRNIFSPESRRAIVANQPLIFGIGRMLQAYFNMAVGKEQANVFYNREAALKWLGDEDLGA
jgi:hypothetical protein